MEIITLNALFNNTSSKIDAIKNNSRNASENAYNANTNYINSLIIYKYTTNSNYYVDTLVNKTLNYNYYPHLYK